MRHRELTDQPQTTPLDSPDTEGRQMTAIQKQDDNPIAHLVFEQEAVGEEAETPLRLDLEAVGAVGLTQRGDVALVEQSAEAL